MWHDLGTSTPSETPTITDMERSGRLERDVAANATNTVKARQVSMPRLFDGREPLSKKWTLLANAGRSEAEQLIRNPDRQRRNRPQSDANPRETEYTPDVRPRG